MIMMMMMMIHLKGRIDTDATWKYELLERGILSAMTLAFT